MVQDEVTITRNIKTMGLSEAAVDEEIAEFFGHDNPYLGIYSKADGIHLRIIARARDATTARDMIQPVEAAIVARLARYVWGYDDETPEQAVGTILSERGLTLATLESCTGGYLVNSLTEVPDYSRFFKGGAVASNPEMLTALGVPSTVLQEHGLVSQASATAMGRAIRERLGADFGIGLTGVPGPAELEGKPMGLAYLALVNNTEVKEWQMRVPPRRITIKRRVSNNALIELCKLLTAAS
jgi:nicotinamide-nucleotide amidase